MRSTIATTITLIATIIVGPGFAVASNESGAYPTLLVDGAAETAGGDPFEHGPDLADIQYSIYEPRDQLEDLEEDYGKLTRDDILRPRWNDRFEFRSYDGDFRLIVGARVENDYAWYDPDEAIDAAFGPIDDANEFRRARLVAAANLYENIQFFSQYDFTGSNVSFASVFIGFRDVPYVHNVRVGQFEEPLGLERVTSHRFLTFMERALTNAITPVRSVGVMLHDEVLDRRGTWWIGIFRESNSRGETIGVGGNAVTSRFTLLPIYSDEGRRLVHLGVSYSYRTFLDDEVNFRNRPESNLSPRFVETGDFLADSTNLLATELATVWGPLSLQGEYIHNFTNAQSGEELEFSAFYLYLSWIMTGEHRTYSRSKAAFRRVFPYNNFAWKNGCFTGLGAWELAGRVSGVDLDDGSITGGRELNGTLGVNWYMNPNTRMMFNFIFADREDIGDTRIFQTRLQLDF